MSDNCCTVTPRQCLEQCAYLKSSLCFVGLATETVLCAVSLIDLAVRHCRVVGRNVSFVMVVAQIDKSEVVW
jgi:hypothetical protein